MAVRADDSFREDFIVQTLAQAFLMVTTAAQLVCRFFQQSREFGIMGDMAAQAGPDHRRTMAEGTFEKIRMTDGAEFGARRDET